MAVPYASPCFPLQVQRSGRELGEAQRELATARSRAEAAVRAADLAQSSAQQSVEKLEEEVGSVLLAWATGGLA